MQRTSWMLLGLCLALGTPGGVATSAPQRTHKVKFKDYFGLSYLLDARVSPNGQYVAYVELRWLSAPSGRSADLWVVETKTKQVRRLTFSRHSDVAPRWSADSQWIYFLSRRPKGKSEPALKKRQVWRIRVDGSRLMPVTKVGKGIGLYSLSATGDKLYYSTSSKKPVKTPFVALRKRHKSVRYGHHMIRPGELWALDLRTWRHKRLYKSKRVIRTFSVAPNNQAIAILTSPDRSLLSNEGWSRIEVVDLRTGKVHLPPDKQWRKQAPSPYGWLSLPRWSASSQMLSFVVSFDGYPSELYVLQLDGKYKVQRSTRLKRDKQIHLEGHVQWHPKRPVLCYKATNLALSRVFCTSFKGATQQGTRTLNPKGLHTHRYHIGADGRSVVQVAGTLTILGDVFLQQWNQKTPKTTRLTRINPQVDTWKLPQISKVQWKSKDGTIVEGILELPPGYKKGKKLPLVVLIHGGPTASSKRVFRFSNYGRTTFASRGWATLSPNYRGSTGYGDKFLTQLIGHKNDLDVADIMSGVDHLIKVGLVDPKRMAVMGWSNGGYLTNCLITHTDRFKAASSGAGVFDTAMQWMIEDTPGHVINFSKGLPWQKSKALQRSSPLYQAHRIKTPTLIHVGERDPRVPPQHSYALYRTLRRYLKVPTQLLVYPKAYHGLRSRAHRSAKMMWELRWFDYYVLGKGRKQPKRRPAKRTPPPSKQSNSPS